MILEDIEKSKEELRKKLAQRCDDVKEMTDALSTIDRLNSYISDIESCVYVTGLCIGIGDDRKRFSQRDAGEIIDCIRARIVIELSEFVGGCPSPREFVQKIRDEAIEQQKGETK